MIKKEGFQKPQMLTIKISLGFISPISFYIMGKHCQFLFTLQLKTTENDFHRLMIKHKSYATPQLL